MIHTDLSEQYQTLVGKRIVEVLRVPNWFILVFDDGQRLPYPDIRTMAIEPRPKVHT